MVEEKFKIILADPPWKFKTYSVPKDGKRFRPDCQVWRNADIHYSTMTLDQIKQLPVGELAEKDSVLFLWTTFPYLQKSFGVVDAWGFKFKTVGFVWIKLNKRGGCDRLSQESEIRLSDLFMGGGYYTRSNAEICLLCSKGRGVQRVDRSVRQVVLSRRRAHSQKPDEVRERIVQLFGDLSRVELFAREKAEGWLAWGKDVENDIEFA